MIKRVDALAHALQVISGKERPTVATCGPNTLAHFATIMAVHASGGILAPINARNSAQDVEAQINRVEPDFIFFEKKTASLFENVDRKKISGTTTEQGAILIEDLLEKYEGKTPTWPDVSLKTVNAVKFTGGTSGVPKGVEQSFLCVSTLIETMLETFEFDAEDRHLCIAPISHGAGTFMVPILAAGGMNYLMGDPSPANILACLEDEKMTTAFAPPTLLYAVMDAAGDRQPDLGALRHVVYGAAAMPPEKVRQARAFFNGKLEVVYGQTEMPVVMTVMRASELNNPDLYPSCGRRTARTEISIVDPDGNHLPAGEIGEIVGRGDLMMNGYYKQPEETAKTIVDGWLHTGDVGYLNEDGYLFIKDRLRDVVITGGFNVYPIEVEDTLVKHPAVRECVVFGVADDKWGERVVTALELYPDQSATEDDIIQFAKDAIGSVKAPKDVMIVDELPRSHVGKVLRRDAKKLFEETQEPAQ